MFYNSVYNQNVKFRTKDKTFHSTRSLIINSSISVLFKKLIFINGLYSYSSLPTAILETRHFVEESLIQQALRRYVKNIKEISQCMSNYFSIKCTFFFFLFANSLSS